MVNAQLLEEIKRLLRGNGADCVQLRCGSASKGPTCFHQQCYGRPVRLSKALTLYSKTKNNEGMEEYCMHDGRHRACDMCLMEVQGSTDCLYKGASGESAHLITYGPCNGFRGIKARGWTVCGLETVANLHTLRAGRVLRCFPREDSCDPCNIPRCS